MGESKDHKRKRASTMTKKLRDNHPDDAALARIAKIERGIASKNYKRHMKEMNVSNPLALLGDVVFQKLVAEKALTEQNYIGATIALNAVATVRPL